MPYFIFFVNKPLCIIPFILGIIFCVLVSLLDPSSFIFSAVFLSLSFIIWYPFFLLYYYILSDAQDLQIKGVRLESFRNFFKTIFSIHSIAIPILILIGTYFFPPIVLSVFLIFIYSMITGKILEQYILAKLVSEGIKKNKELVKIDFQDLYNDVRDILTKRLIK